MSTLTYDFEDWLFNPKGLLRFVCDDENQDLLVVAANLNDLFNPPTDTTSESHPQLIPFRILYQDSEYTIFDLGSIFALAIDDGISSASQPDHQVLLSSLLKLELNDGDFPLFLNAIITSDFGQAAILVVEANIYSCPFCHGNVDRCSFQELISSIHIELLESTVTNQFEDESIYYLN